jgi:hypothetical protein
MHQKEAVRRAWSEAGLYDDPDPKLQQFLRLLDDPEQCWSEMAQICRHSFAEYKTRLVQPVLNCGDPLVRLLMIRTLADADDEAPLLESFIAASDPLQHRTELTAIAQRNSGGLNRTLTQKRGLPDEVRAILARAIPASGSG